MLKNYLKTAWRNLTKRKFNTLLLLASLTFALSFSLLIGSYIFQERSVNHDLRNVENQYLIKSNWSQEGMGVPFCSLAPLAKYLHSEYPHLVKNYYTYDGINATVKKGAKVYKESLQPGVASVLSMYELDLLHGDPETALKEPFTVVLPEPMAIKYFGKTDVVGENLSLESNAGEWRPFTVTGILKATAYNSVLNLINEEAPILMSEESLGFFNRLESFRSWENAYTVSNIELHDGVTPTQLEAPIKELLSQHTNQNIQDNLKVELAALSDYYLQDEDGKVNNYLNMLLLVVLFLLVLSTVNFINISLGNASYRLRELGVRKVMGGAKTQAVLQLLTECLVLSVFAFVLAIFAYVGLRGFAGDVLGRALPSLFELPNTFIGSFFGFTLLIGLISGLVAAIKVAKVDTLLSLKSRWSAQPQKDYLNQWLMGLQFAVSILVLGFGFVVIQQLQFLQNKDLGFAKERRLYVATPRDWSPAGVSKMQTIATEFESLSSVEKVAVSYEIPDGKVGLKTGIFHTTKDSSAAVFMNLLQVDDQYLNTFDIPLKQGEGFRENPYSLEVILNAKAADLLQPMDGEPIVGTEVFLQNFGSNAEVVGVCEDYQFGSLKSALKPQAMVNIRVTNMYRYLSFALAEGNLQQNMESVESKWAELLPNAPFEYEFMDETLDKMYRSEARMAKAAKIAQWSVVFLIFLGLVGTLGMHLIKRKKELAIRRVLGATTNEVIQMILKKYLVTLIVAAIIGVPLIYWASQKWLSDYAFSLDINYLWFGMPVVILATFIFLLVSFQSIQFLRKNSVESFTE